MTGQSRGAESPGSSITVRQDRTGRIRRSSTCFGIWRLYHTVPPAMRRPSWGLATILVRHSKRTSTPRFIPRSSYLPAPGGSVFIPAPNSGQRVLVADAVTSLTAENVEAARNSYHYTVPPGGGTTRPLAAKTFTTPHMKGKLPGGGNLLMLDGHAEWRRFELMHVRASNQSSGFSPVPPTFWY